MKFHDQMILDSKDIFKTYSASYVNTHYDAAFSTFDGIVWNVKNWMYYKRNMTFLWNIKSYQFAYQTLHFPRASFLAEVMLNSFVTEIPVIQKPVHWFDLQGLGTCNYIKKRLRHRCFLVTITKFLIILFSQNTPRSLLLENIG